MNVSSQLNWDGSHITAFWLSVPYRILFVSMFRLIYCHHLQGKSVNRRWILCDWVTVLSSHFSTHPNNSVILKMEADHHPGITTFRTSRRYSAERWVWYVGTEQDGFAWWRVGVSCCAAREIMLLAPPVCAIDCIALTMSYGVDGRPKVMRWQLTKSGFEQPYMTAEHHSLSSGENKRAVVRTFFR